MKKLFATLSLCMLASLASAALSVYEPFSYSSGTFPNNTTATGTGLTGKWTCGTSGTISAGLTYTNLSVIGNSLSSGNGRQFVSLASPLSSGTKWISFLYKASGNMGGNIDGVYFPNNNSTCLWFGFGLGPFSGSQGQLGLGSMTTAGTATQGASTLQTIGLGTYASTYLIVLKIDFNTSGANDTVTIYTNPVANVSAPGVTAVATNTSYDVGTISGIGLNVQGGATISIDEIRVGDTYGDVVGYSAGTTTGTNVTSVAISQAIGKQVSWVAQATNSYQVQKSVDNTNFTSLGSLLTGNSTTSIYDTSFSPYYRVLEITYGGAGSNVIADGSFEISGSTASGAANWSSSANDTYDSVYVTNQYGALTPEDGANMMLLEGSTAAATPTAPNTYLLSDLIPVTGGLAYKFSFYAANPVKVGGANPQYRVRFYDTNFAFISEQYSSFASAGSNFTQFATTNTAPANASYTELYFFQAVGAGASWNWVSLIDNVSVNATSSFGPTNILAATVKSGVTFTGTVKTNGVTASAATGSLTFLTNSTALSTNGIAGGVGSSTTAILVPPYTVTAIYSGDATYAPSTNTLTVSNSTVTVALSNLSQTYDGTAKSASATTTPAGFYVALTYNGASSAPTNAGTYQVVGTVVDSDYHGSATNNLVIASNVSQVPTTLVSTISGNQVTLSWPSDHLGWILQSQTNSLASGFSTNWVDVAGSGSSTQSVMTIVTNNPSVFFRLRSP